MEILTRKSEIVPTISGLNPSDGSLWKTELKSAFRDSKSLLSFLELNPEDPQTGSSLTIRSQYL